MNPTVTYSHRLLKGDLSLVFYLTVMKFLIHVVVNASGGYGLFRDELYYLACADNLAMGYVDHPPLSVIILRVVTSIFGDSLFVVRLIPAIAGAFTVFLTGLMAIKLGGRKLAVFLACLFSMSPITQAMFGFYSMNSLEILTWTLASYMMIVIIQEGKPKHWIYLGLILGFGLLNKIGVLFLGAGIFAGLIATKERRWLTTPSPYVAGVIAGILFLPYIIWNMQNDFAHLEFIHNASSEKYSSLSAFTFLKGQLELNNPVAVLIWLPGLFALLLHPVLQQYRILAFMFIIPMGILLINGTSKAEYLAPAYGMLWAAGSVWWENLVATRRFAKYALVIIIFGWLILTALLTPIVLPVLPVETYVSYTKAIGFQPESPEGKEQAELPQFYADMFGWKEKARGVAEVYRSLSEADQKQCAILSDNYGRCGAIDYYGKDYGLPKSIGTHNNYWIWGPRNYTGEVMIIMGGTLEDHQPDFRDVQLAKTIDCQYCMPYEDNVPVFLCRGLKAPLKEIWPGEKHYD